MGKIFVAVAALAVVSVPTGFASAGGRGEVSAQDANYLQTSISGDRFEIIGGKIALAKTGDRSVAALAHRLIRDHSKSLAESVSEARKDGVKVPTAPTPSEVWELDTVRTMTGISFDRFYSSLEVKDHQQDIEETTFEVQHGGDPEIRTSAKKELPMLRMHLMLSERALHSA
jgi:predicted outer membrane protein